ncbi:MAG TPA: carbamoyltransferase HypF, partial [Bryobacteraceae bacterium]
RRFHAQPTACADCGPHLFFHPGGEKGDDALAAAQHGLAAGRIVAIKGIGGFHLSCDASNDAAVNELRRRKGRGGKPFAVMACDLDAVRRYAHVNEDEARVLCGRERPIVLLDRLANVALSESVAPGQAQLGFFLPYSPVHHLLVGERPLVMTSGNRSEEPIVRENAEALDRLSALADAFLLHNRDIHVVCDDSVVRIASGRELPIRRSRGYAPMPVRLPFAGPSVLAVGGELKATFCVTKGTRAYLSQHIGDMENLETLQAFERALAQMRRLFRIDPEAVVCDLHPGYLSTRWAQEFAASSGLPLIQIQHHHAHAASLMAEHGEPPDAQIIAVTFDGTGLGTDGAIWGGEILATGYGSFERLGHLSYVPLPGGDAAIKRPYRTALAHLYAAGIEWKDDLPCVQACPEPERKILNRQLTQRLNSPSTSSAGRLFDAAASLLGIRHEVTYEAQGAMEMEALARRSIDAAEPYGFQIDEQEPFTCNPAPLWKNLIEGIRQRIATPILAARFHQTIAHLIAECCLKARARTGLNTVGLTGGVFQNVLLLDLAQTALNKEGFRVLTHRIVPPNDGGLALGQAAAGRAYASKMQRPSS